MNKGDYINYARKIDSFFKQKKCLYFDNTECSNVIIKSHTIQKKRSLQFIAENGQVLGFSKNYNVDEYSSPIVLSRIGINEASTFYGFCKTHDNKLFHPIDDFEFVPTDEQVYLLTYRTFIRELYAKMADVDSYSTMDEFLGKVENLSETFRDNVESHYMGAAWGKQDDLHFASIMFNHIKANDYSGIKYVMLEIDTIPEVMISGLVTPEFDYENNRIQNLSLDPYQKNFALNVFSDGKKGIILFSWLDDFDVEPFIESLFKQDDYLNKIIEIGFTFLNNIYFNETWYNSLSVIKKLRIDKMMHNLIHYDFDTGEYTGIRRNNLHYVDWKVINVKSNIKDFTWL